SGQYVGTSPDFQARLGQATTGDAGGPGDNQIARDDNYSVSSRMADAGAGDVTRSVNNVEPFDSGTNAAAPTSEFIGGDIQHDPGMDATRNFMPSDSADVQREMLDGTNDGGALGNTGSGHPS
ncbi:MAG TPA: hypothetical protein VKD46_05075, partial [bacterium]|nr:hypothetical protein [bacterium]